MRVGVSQDHCSERSGPVVVITPGASSDCYHCKASPGPSTTTRLTTLTTYIPVPSCTRRGIQIQTQKKGCQDARKLGDSVAWSGTEQSYEERLPPSLKGSYERVFQLTCSLYSSPSPYHNARQLHGAHRSLWEALRLSKLAVERHYANADLADRNAICERGVHSRSFVFFTRFCLHSHLSCGYLYLNRRTFRRGVRGSPSFRHTCVLPPFPIPVSPPGCVFAPR
ncbi:hypothetical protein F5148DRAFT_104163 [Russula earlei]|uniref:Uncharacterized protein n=1 Tax=Russula earlei TaxID=71964 RepID=A0ACC0U869_9AGAM|nr:hypothetical protein F5148DRAFT_104163 [Russula earlei]